jgi:hypothetical protein
MNSLWESKCVAGGATVAEVESEPPSARRNAGAPPCPPPYSPRSTSTSWSPSTHSSVTPTAPSTLPPRHRRENAACASANGIRFPRRTPRCRLSHSISATSVPMTSRSSRRTASSQHPRRSPTRSSTGHDLTKPPSSKSRTVSPCSSTSADTTADATFKGDAYCRYWTRNQAKRFVHADRSPNHMRSADS